MRIATRTDPSLLLPDPVVGAEGGGGATAVSSGTCVIVCERYRCVGVTYQHGCFGRNFAGVVRACLCACVMKFEQVESVSEQKQCPGQDNAEAAAASAGENDSVSIDGGS